jgi:hypothetical protein
LFLYYFSLLWVIKTITYLLKTLSNRCLLFLFLIQINNFLIYIVTIILLEYLLSIFSLNLFLLSTIIFASYSFEYTIFSKSLLKVINLFHIELFNCLIWSFFTFQFRSPSSFIIEFSTLLSWSVAKPTISC